MLMTSSTKVLIWSKVIGCVAELKCWSFDDSPRESLWTFEVGFDVFVCFVDVVEELVVVRLVEVDVAGVDNRLRFWSEG